MNENLVENNPNYTQVSNLFIDNLKLFSESEIRIFLFITRKTIGFHDETKKCSISYIMEGTGMSKQGVIKGTSKLLKNKWLIRTKIKDKNGYTYEYTLSDKVKLPKPTSQRSRLVNEVDRSTKLTGTSQLSRQHAVNEVDTNKETIKRNYLKKPYTQSETEVSEESVDKNKILSKKEEEMFEIYRSYFNSYSGRETKGTKAQHKAFKKFTKEAEFIPSKIEHTVYCFCNDRWRKDAGALDLAYLFRPAVYSKFENMSIKQLNENNFLYCKKNGLDHKTVKDIFAEREKAKEVQQKEPERELTPEEKEKQEKRTQELMRINYIKMASKNAFFRSKEKEEKYGIVDFEAEVLKLKQVSIAKEKSE